MTDYSSAVRYLALPMDDPPALPKTPQQSTTRPYTYNRPPPPPPTFKQRLVRQSNSIGSRLFRLCSRLTRRQWIWVGLFIVQAIIVGVLFSKYQRHFFGSLTSIAKHLRGINGGWLILWMIKFIVAFPPLFGGSTAVTLSGLVYGVWKGWLIMASATVIGSTASFIVSRALFKDFITRRVEKDKRFKALALTLKHDGLKLLIMIRFCPLPYSLANAAIATIPTVSWFQFAFATSCTTPMLLLPIFTANRLGALAEHHDTMDTSTKILSYMSIVFGFVVGITTGTLIYRKTKARARELEAQAVLEGVGDMNGRQSFRDVEDGCPDDESRQDDSISLHTTHTESNRYQDDLGDEVEGEQYPWSWRNVRGPNEDLGNKEYRDDTEEVEVEMDK